MQLDVLGNKSECQRIFSKYYSIPISAEPYFPYQIGNMFVDPNQQVKWRCKAVARPKATYTWYKNGEVLQPIPGEIEVSGNILTVRAVQKERDEGMYQCGASNLHGTTFSTGRLKVVCEYCCEAFSSYWTIVIHLIMLYINVNVPKLGV